MAVTEPIMEQELTIEAPLEHPCYAGHFPQRPIVPGVVLLDLVVAALQRGAPREIGSVKFHRAVKPGDHFILRYELTGPQLSFRCVSGDQLLVDGRLRFAT